MVTIPAPRQDGQKKIELRKGEEPKSTVNKQFNDEFIKYVAQNTLDGVTESETVGDLVNRIKGILAKDDPVIEADRSSDYEHIWSHAASNRFDARHMMGLVLDLATKLGESDLYSKETLDTLDQMTQHEQSRFSFVSGGSYNLNRDALRKFALEYLKANASDDTGRALVENYIRTSPEPVNMIGSHGPVLFQKAQMGQ